MSRIATKYKLQWRWLGGLLCCIACHSSCSAADSNSSSITNTKISSYTGLCRSYNVQLNSNYIAAVQDAYGAVLQSKLAAIGNPDVLFDTPITASANPGDVTSWTICIPVFLPPGSAASDPYKIVDIPETAGIETSCGPTDAERQACAAAMSQHLTQTGLLASRMSQLKTLSDGSVVITLAVVANH